MVLFGMVWELRSRRKKYAFTDSGLTSNEKGKHSRGENYKYWDFFLVVDIGYCGLCHHVKKRWDKTFLDATLGRGYLISEQRACRY